MKTNKTLIWAHRGASGLVPFENTIDAFQKAIDVKADGIELDIRKTQDGVIIVNHNRDVCGQIIAEHTYEELKETAKNAGWSLATFEETLAYCQGKIFLDIEFKEAGYEQEALDMILKYYKLDEFNIRSFVKEALINLHNINKDVHTILLMCPKGGKKRNALPVIFPKKQIKETYSHGVSPHFKAIMFGYTNRMHRHGWDVSPWTVNNEEDMKKMLKKHVDMIVTNYPDKALALRDEIQK